MDISLWSGTETCEAISMRSAICTGSLFLLFVVFSVHVTSAQTAVPCNQFASGSTPPAGYATAWNVLTSAKELLVFATCGTNSTIFTVGSEAQNQYVYKLSYSYSNVGGTAGTWVSFVLSGSFAQGSTDWLLGKGSATYGKIASNPLYWVGYVCQWTGSAWKCRCRDSACATNYWQLQASSDPYPSGGAGSTATGNELALCNASSGNIRNVSSAAQLSSALSNASPGDLIIVAGGSYAGNFTLSRSGTASNPIVIKGASASNRPRITGRIVLSGDYGVVEGFEFTGNAGVTITGDHNRATRNYSHHYTSGGVFLVQGSGSNNRIDHNEIADLTDPSKEGIYGIRVSVGKAEADADRHPKNNRIDHNYLHDLLYVGGNGREPILTGVISYVSHGTLIDHNLLVRAGSDEIIGVKGSDVRIIGNTIIDGGQIYASNRLGSRNLWKNNWFENAQLRVYGKGNQLIGNNLSQGGGIHLLRGDITAEQFDQEWRNSTPKQMEPSYGRYAGGRQLGRYDLSRAKIQLSSPGQEYPPGSEHLHDRKGASHRHDRKSNDRP